MPERRRIGARRYPLPAGGPRASDDITGRRRHHTRLCATEGIGTSMDPPGSTNRRRGGDSAATLLLAGATGLVGGHVLELALADPRVESIVAPSRRDLRPHPKLRAPRVDFAQLPEEAAWWRADAVICALGTTMKNAGSRGAFHRV